MSTIVVGVEGSADSLLALRWAVEEARQRGAVLRVVHAYQTAGSPAVVDLLDGHAREVLDAAMTEAIGLASDVTIVPELDRDHTAARGLLRRGADADLLVVGSRGLGGFTGLLVGSVSDQCAHYAPCPVVIVRCPPEVTWGTGGAGPAASGEPGAGETPERAAG